MLFLAHQPQQVGYNDDPTQLNGIHDQEVPTEDNAYEEINNHVSNGEDVVDLQNQMQNGHSEVDRAAPAQQIQQEVRLYLLNKIIFLPISYQIISVDFIYTPLNLENSFISFS